MEEKQVVEREILQYMSSLPEKGLDKLLCYVKQLASQEEGGKKKDIDDNRDRFVNSYIGGVSNGFLADNIDDDLYG